MYPKALLLARFEFAAHTEDRPTLRVIMTWDAASIRQRYVTVRLMLSIWECVCRSKSISQLCYPRSPGGVHLHAYNWMPTKQKSFGLALLVWRSWPYIQSCFLASTRESVSQTASRSVQQFVHNSRQRVPIYFIMGRPFPTKNCPFACGDLDPT